MKIQVNTGKTVKGSDRLESFVSEKVNKSLKRYADQITRLEVHITDENGEKAGKDDIHCKLEARVKGLNPVVVNSKGDEIDVALNAATEKLKSALDTVTGKLKDKK